MSNPIVEGGHSLLEKEGEGLYRAKLKCTIKMYNSNIQLIQYLCDWKLNSSPSEVMYYRIMYPVNIIGFF